MPQPPEPCWFSSSWCVCCVRVWGKEIAVVSVEEKEVKEEQEAQPSIQVVWLAKPKN